MEVVLSEDKKTFGFLDSEEDALLNEAICCSRNLEIKTDDENESEAVETSGKDSSCKQMKIEEPEKKTTDIPWCDIESSDSSVSNLSTSNAKIDLSTSGGKLDSSVPGIKMEPQTSDIKVENGQSADCPVKAEVQSSDIKIENGQSAADYPVKVKTEEEPANGMDTTETNEHKTSANSSGNTSPVRKRMRQKEDNTEEETEVFRTRRNSNSSTSTMSSNSKRNIEYETDSTVLARRQKDVDYGKNTIGYDKYIQDIPRYEYRG